MQARLQRVEQGGCSWAAHPEFAKDLAGLSLDDLTKRELKRLMQRAREGTVRHGDFKNPLVTGNGLVGELRLNQEDHKYRIYYNEPPRAPAMLYALLAGVKRHSDEDKGKAEQQKQIEKALNRLLNEPFI